MVQVIIFLVSFLFVYLIYYFMVLRKEDKLGKFKTSTEVNYLKKVYHIKVNKFDMKWFARKVILMNSLIISIAALLATLVDNMILMILLGFVVLFPAILGGYHILGKYLQQKQKEMK